jgi:fatty-acyl-CoA synthase
VEEALASHPAVREAAVVGVPDDLFGERLRAFVVPRGTARPDPDDLRRHVRSRLANFKVPRDVVVVESLPRNAAGKTLHRELRQR